MKRCLQQCKVSETFKLDYWACEDGHCEMRSITEIIYQPSPLMEHLEAKRDRT